MSAAVIICVRRGRGTRRCTFCKRVAPTRLCDAPRAANAALTCDRALCDGCAVTFDGELDLCPSHAAATFRSWAKFIVVAGEVPSPANAGVDVHWTSAPAMEVV